MQPSRGIQVQEERGPDQPIERLSASRTAFVGRTLRGPVNEPVLVRSFADFQLVFGGLWQPSLLSYAVEHYFDNGGSEALVVRVQNGARSSTLSLPAGDGTLVLRAVRPGTREFLRACVDYDNVDPGSATHFNLTVQRIRTQGLLRVEDQETFRNLSLDPASTQFIGGALADSELVRLQEPLPAVRPDLTTDSITGVAAGYVYSNADGDDGAPLTDYDLVGSAVESTGLFALDDGPPFSLLCMPPTARGQDIGIGALMIAARFCRDRRAMLVVDPPEAWATADDALAGLRDWPLASEDALMFFPRILAHDKLRGRFEAFAPCGAVAGMLARSDEDGEPVLRPGFRPVCWIPEDRRARLAAHGVNTLLTVRAAAPSHLRLRTLGAANSAASDWRYLSTRRRVLAIINSIERGTRWAAVAPPHDDVAPLLEAQVRRFLGELHASGAFGALAPQDAWYVVVDRHRGGARRDVHFLVGLAAERAGEFHGFRISHSPAGSQVRPVVLDQLSDPRPLQSPAATWHPQVPQLR